MEWIEFLLYMIELFGTIAFAVSGAMIAIERRMDLFGIIFLGIITALGGGTLRDVMLGITPPRMFYNYEYLFVAAICSCAVFLLARCFREQYKKNTLIVNHIINCFDAMGLGIFAVSGVQVTIEAGYGSNAFLAIVLGMTTGVGGGILRDVMSHTIPFVLRKRIYAIAAILGAAVYYLLYRFSVSTTVATLIGIATTFLIRMLATKYEWSLPKAL